MTRTPAFWGYPPPPHDYAYYWVILDPKSNPFYCEVMAKWPWRYRSRSKVITCDTPSDANDDLCQIWKECKQNCRFFSRWNPKKIEKLEMKYGNNRSRTENVTEWTRFSKSRSDYLEYIGQGQRSSHATHLLKLVIICTKYGKNPSRTVDATERTRFSRPRPNDLEDIG